MRTLHEKIVSIILTHQTIQKKHRAYEIEIEHK